jgi:hypothetical protein
MLRRRLVATLASIDSRRRFEFARERNRAVRDADAAAFGIAIGVNRP